MSHRWHIDHQLGIVSGFSIKTRPELQKDWADYLRDVPHVAYEAYKDKLSENWRKRAEHYYTEMMRVQKGAET